MITELTVVKATPSRKESKMPPASASVSLRASVTASQLRDAVSSMVRLGGSGVVGIRGDSREIISALTQLGPQVRNTQQVISALTQLGPGSGASARISISGNSVQVELGAKPY